jgi:hypothetical protein
MSPLRTRHGRESLIDCFSAANSILGITWIRGCPLNGKHKGLRVEVDKCTENGLTRLLPDPVSDNRYHKEHDKSVAYSR